MIRFVLQKIDLETGSVVEQANFSTDDVSKLTKLIEVEAFQPGMSFELSGSEFIAVADLHSVTISRDAAKGELICVAEDFKFDPNSHTGRELFLMLQQKKPLSVFSDSVETFDSTFASVEQAFEQYVASGKIIKHTYEDKKLQNSESRIKNVMFVVPEEAWRIPAYKAVWHLATKYGWNVGLERMEGYLLGYETDIDEFHPVQER